MTTQPDWRSAADAGEQKYSWRKPQPYANPTKSRWKRMLRLLGAFVGLVVTLYLIWLIFNFVGRSQIDIVTLGVSGFASGEMPDNPFAARDMTSFKSLEGLETLFQKVSVQSQDLNSESGRIEILDRHRNASCLILYVNCWSDLNGDEWCLLDRGSTPEESRLVPLSVLWEELRSLPPRQHKLVLLDICRVQPNWRLGTLPAVIDEPIFRQLQDHNVPNLVVMLSDAISTGSQGSARLGNGQSAFAHFALQGLARLADDNQDRRIDVLELYKFVEANVRNWSQDCRDAERPQTPLLIPSPSQIGLPEFQSLNFTLLHFTESSALTAIEAPTASPDVKVLEKALRRREALQTREVWQRAPLQWTRLNDGLQRAETHYLSRNATEFRRVLSKEVDPLLNQLEDISVSPSELFPERLDAFVRNLLAEPLDEVYGRDDQRSSNSKAEAATESDLESPTRIAQRHLRDECISPIDDSDRTALIDEVTRLRQQADLLFGSRMGAFEVIAVDLPEVEQALRETENLVLAHAEESQIQSQYSQTRDMLNRLVRRVEIRANALKLRDEAAMMLPQLASWAAYRQRSPKSDDLVRQHVQSSKDGVLGTVQELSSEAGMEFSEAQDQPEQHVLALFIRFREMQKLLENSGSEDSLQKLSVDLEQNVAGVRKLFTETARKLEGKLDTNIQRSHRREYIDILRIDWIPASTRLALLNRLENVESELNVGSKLQTGLQIEKQPTRRLPADDLDITAKDCIWQTFWMIQHASTTNEELDIRAWCTQWSDIAIDYERPARQIAQAHELSDRIVSQWRKIRVQVQDLTGKRVSVQLDHSKKLRRADALTRLIPSHEAGILMRSRVTPTTQYELLCLIHRLTYLSGRCAEDFWANCESNSQQPWYERSSKLLSSVASEMQREELPSAEWVLPELKTVGARREELAQAALRPVIGNEDKQINLQFVKSQIVPVATQSGAAQLPEGTAMLWLRQAAQDIQVTPLTLCTPANRPQSELQFTLQLPRNSGEIDNLEVQPEVRFRGHNWRADRRLLVDARRDQGRSITFDNLTAPGTISVTGSDRRKVMFLLDCSFSMSFPYKATTHDKFYEATQTLRQVWATMGEEDQVGLMAFGNRVDGTDEKKISGWETDYEVVQAMAELNLEVDGRDQRQLLNDKMTDLAAIGLTPAVGAMAKALRELQKFTESEPGALVVVTDGAAQDGGIDPEKSKWSEFDRQHKNELVYIVAYNVEPDEKPLLQKYKEEVAKRNNIIFKEAPTTEELKRELDEALKPREYFVIDKGDKSQREKARLGTVIERPAGTYSVEFAGRQFEIPLGVGQDAVLDVSWDTGEVQLKRTLESGFREFQAASGEFPEGVPKTAAVKDFVRHADGSAHLTVILEHADPAKAVLQPEEMHLAIFRNGEAVSTDLQIKPAAKVSVPAYEVKMSEWPEDQGVEVHAAWKMERTTPDLVYTLKELKVFDDQAIEARLGDKPVRIFAQPENNKLHIHVKYDDSVEFPEMSYPISLDQLRVEIGVLDSSGKLLPNRELIRRVEVFANEKLVVTHFESSSGNLNSDSLGVAITSPEALLHNAYMTIEGIKVHDFDRVE